MKEIDCVCEKVMEATEKIGNEFVKLANTLSGNEDCCSTSDKKSYCLTSEGYSIIHEKNQNKLVIYLPQTQMTAISTVLPVGNRKEDLTDYELLQILELVKYMFKEKEGS